MEGRGTEAWSKAATCLEHSLRKGGTDRDLLDGRATQAFLGRARANVFEKLGDQPSARADLLEVICLGPEAATLEHYLGALVELSNLEYHAGRYESALGLCDLALELSNDRAARRQRAKVLLALNRYSKAGKELDSYLSGFQGRRQGVFGL